jgi:endoglucanase
VHLDKPLPAALAGKAGFNLDFLPTAYFGKSYSADAAFGIFPRHPEGPMRAGADGAAEPMPLTTGRRIVLAPEDPATRVALSSETGRIMLFDARNRAQNGWFVLRELIPGNRTENALVWHVHPNVIAGWIRPPVVSYNQVGYTPDRAKVALLEFDSRYQPPPTARILRLTDTGTARSSPGAHGCAIGMRPSTSRRCASPAFTPSTTQGTGRGHFESPPTCTAKACGSPVSILTSRYKWTM